MKVTERYELVSLSKSVHDLTEIIRQNFSSSIANHDNKTSNIDFSVFYYNYNKTIGCNLIISKDLLTEVTYQCNKYKYKSDGLKISIKIYFTNEDTPLIFNKFIELHKTDIDNDDDYIEIIDNDREEYKEYEAIKYIEIEYDFYNDNEFDTEYSLLLKNIPLIKFNKYIHSLSHDYKANNYLEDIIEYRLPITTDFSGKKIHDKSITFKTLYGFNGSYYRSNLGIEDLLDYGGKEIFDLLSMNGFYCKLTIMAPFIDPPYRDPIYSETVYMKPTGSGVVIRTKSDTESIVSALAYQVKNDLNYHFQNTDFLEFNNEIRKGIEIKLAFKKSSDTELFEKALIQWTKVK